MTRRIVRTACLGVVLGLLSTLALAWVMPAVLGAWKGLPNVPDRFWIDDTRGGHYQVVEERFSAQALFNHVIITGAAKDQPSYMQNPPPPWVYTLTHAMHGDPPADGQAWWAVETYACGWPRLAFRGAWYEPWVPQGQPAPSFTLVDGKIVQLSPPRPREMVMGLWKFGGAGDRFKIPLRPMWGGLVLNVAVLSGGWIVVLVLVGAGRRWNRVRRGRCPVCGYDMTGLVTCPECGWKGKCGYAEVAKSAEATEELRGA